jgi:hypothetical protein
VLSDDGYWLRLHSPEVAAAAPKPHTITCGKQPSDALREPTAGERCQTGVGQAESGAAWSLRTSLAPFAPAHGLFQHQFAATKLSDDGVRVNFEAVGGVKQTFAIRGHVVDLMNDAEENDEGSKWSVLGDFFRASDLR